MWKSQRIEGRRLPACRRRRAFGKTHKKATQEVLQDQRSWSGGLLRQSYFAFMGNLQIQQFSTQFWQKQPVVPEAVCRKAQELIRASGIPACNY